MAMRNFYLTADIDGRETLLTGGPRAKDGMMTVDIRQRDEGSIVRAFYIDCIERDGELTTTVYDNKGNKVADFTTKR